MDHYDRLKKQLSEIETIILTENEPTQDLLCLWNILQAQLENEIFHNELYVDLGHE